MSQRIASKEKICLSLAGLVRPLLALVLTFTGWNSANAQQVFGNIFGTITDAYRWRCDERQSHNHRYSERQPVRGAIRCLGQLYQRQLVPDPYTVAMEAPGFQRIVSSLLEVRVDEAARFDEP